ncbi:hypothetical protein ACFU3J_20945 [Streptomyces sp. NPDC057411]|uniref:hypothetical protein n=1 Tax=unclassified Streptomyces TaxID=2593676 RepID=UPI0036362C18
MTPAAPFGPLEFQLVLLRRMADHQPGLVEDALRALGTTRTAMREANKRWQARARARPSPTAARPDALRAAPSTPGGPVELDLYRAALGEPESRRALPGFPAGHEEWAWPVPLWPELRFTAYAGPGRAVWSRALTRAPGAPAPALRGAADLLPWRCTIDEVYAAFPGARAREQASPALTRLDFTLPDGTACAAEFAWGLLQRLLPVTP